MIRVKDPHKSIDFYQKLGFSLVDTLRQPEAQFDLYFLGHDAQGKSPSAGKQRSDRQGLLELTHNYGTESDEEYTVSNGNDEPHLGFQHLGIAVDDIDAARERLISLAVDRYVRTGEQGGRQTGAGRNEMAILQDPDGYYVELNPKGSTTAGTDISNYLFNFTGLRIKDPRVSLPWYTNVLGLKLHQQEGGENVTTYWLGYPGDSQSGSPRSVLEREGIVKLIWIHGSELEEGQVYHNGNNQPQGFGHLGETDLQTSSLVQPHCTLLPKECIMLTRTHLCSDRCP